MKNEDRIATFIQQQLAQINILYYYFVSKHYV